MPKDNYSWERERQAPGCAVGCLAMAIVWGLRILFVLLLIGAVVWFLRFLGVPI